MKGSTNPREQPVPPRPLVAVKGSQDSLRIVVSSGEPDAIEGNLREQLARSAGSFFRGSGVELELPSTPLDMDLVTRLAAVIEAAGMAVHRIVGRSADAPPPRRDKGRAASAPQVSPEAALVANGPLRSGQRVVHEGSVVVLGDVNPGAEVVAGGSVIVWGRLRGKVEAGLVQEQGAVVCALDLAPTQLRIGPALARTPEEPGRTPTPEMARQSGSQIVVDAWQP